MQEAQVQSLSWEDPPEKGMATHSSGKSCLGNPTWEIPWTEELGGPQSIGSSHAQLFGTPWTVAHQAPGSMGFSREEYWSG